MVNLAQWDVGVQLKNELTLNSIDPLSYTSICKILAPGALKVSLGSWHMQIVNQKSPSVSFLEMKLILPARSNQLKSLKLHLLNGLLNLLLHVCSQKVMLQKKKTLQNKFTSALSLHARLWDQQYAYLSPIRGNGRMLTLVKGEHGSSSGKKKRHSC